MMRLQKQLLAAALVKWHLPFTRWRRSGAHSPESRQDLARRLRNHDTWWSAVIVCHLIDDVPKWQNIWDVEAEVLELNDESKQNPGIFSCTQHCILPPQRRATLKLLNNNLLEKFPSPISAIQKHLGALH